MLTAAAAHLQGQLIPKRRGRRYRYIYSLNKPLHGSEEINSCMGDYNATSGSVNTTISAQLVSGSHAYTLLCAEVHK